MQVILIDKVVNLGNLGDVVKVKDGYARNFLIPHRHARVAPRKPTWKRSPRRRPNWKALQPKNWPSSQRRAEKLEGCSVTISQKAGVDGRLFGSITNADIADALKAQGHEVAKSEIRLPKAHSRLLANTRWCWRCTPTSPPTSRWW